MVYDRIIIGAGIYGLYAAKESVKKGHRVLVLDADDGAFTRGTYINQARLHNGYHYPRSFSTASKSARYFQRFLKDFEDCININFEKVYAVAANFSWANGKQFKEFSDRLGVRCDEIDKGIYFNKNEIDKSFITTEYTFDAMLIKKRLLKELESKCCQIVYNAAVTHIQKDNGVFSITVNDGRTYTSSFVLNATYASTNQIHKLVGYEMLNIKYELCEVIICNVSNKIKDVGITVMDGPFFSVMPFGKTGYHSLTTVSRTPHITSYEQLPTFDCMKENPACTSEQLSNCNCCPARPQSAFDEMNQISKKYLNEEINIEYVDSLFTIKPIMKSSEIDDSRPTLIKQYSSKPEFYTVFSGKINTMYDLDEIL